MPVPASKVATTDERLGIDLPLSSSPRNKTVNLPGIGAGPTSAQPIINSKKPILKHRTLSEMLTIPMPSSPILESSYRDDDVDNMDDELDRPVLMQTKSDTNIFRNRGTVSRKRSPPRQPGHSGKHTPASGELTPETQQPQSGKRHISFNTFVEQCMAIDEPEMGRVDEESDDEDDDMLEIRSSHSHSSSNRSLRPSISRNSSSGSGDHLTIAKIAPTMLKTVGVPTANMPQMVYAPPAEYLSPPLIAQGQPQSQFDFPSPVMQTRQRWAGAEGDEYGSEGFDYFGGPDLGSSPQQQNISAAQVSPQVIPSHVGRATPPTVGQPPNQPKWRQSPESSTPSSSSSSSSIANNFGLPSPQQPARSILKVRPPGSAPPAQAEPSSPTSTYFNYNPSAATGIGGMRAGGGGFDYPGPSGSPIVSPDVSTGGQQPTAHATAVSPAAGGAKPEETRGRSAVRERGSALDNRSSSRGTSASSSAGQSPGAARSPTVQAPASMAQQQYPKVPQVQVQGQIQGGSGGRGTEGAGVGADGEERAEGAWDRDEPMDVDEGEAGPRAETPTPHSSPQVSSRRFPYLTHFSSRRSFVSSRKVSTPYYNPPPDMRCLLRCRPPPLLRLDSHERFL